MHDAVHDIVNSPGMQAFFNVESLSSLGQSESDKKTSMKMT